jgi:hypothetical protein
MAEVMVVRTFHSSRAPGKLHFHSGYFVFKNENVKVKVKYGIVLLAGFARSPFYFSIIIITSYLKMSGMPWGWVVYTDDFCQNNL